MGNALFFGGRSLSATLVFHTMQYFPGLHSFHTLWPDSERNVKIFAVTFFTGNITGTFGHVLQRQTCKNKRVRRSRGLLRHAMKPQGSETQRKRTAVRYGR